MKFVGVLLSADNPILTDCLKACLNEGVYLFLADTTWRKKASNSWLLLAVPRASPAAPASRTQSGTGSAAAN